MDFFLEHETLRSIIGDASARALLRDLAIFSLAALIHSSRVKKSMSHITDAINNLGAALRQDLSMQSERIGRVEERMSKIESQTKN